MDEGTQRVDEESWEGVGASRRSDFISSRIA